MPFVDLIIPTRATVTGNGWNSPSNALAEDDTWATCGGQDITSVLNISKFERKLPMDVQIDGIEATIYAKASDTNGSRLAVSLMRNGVHAWGSTKYSGTLTTTASAIVLGGPTDKWGNTEIPVGFVDDNDNFGLRISQLTEGDGSEIDYVHIRVYYTAFTSYLTGSRSKFPNAFDEDSITEARNGTSPDQQVRSEMANLLGDCLYNIEKVALSQSNDVRLIGPPGAKTYLWSITVSGQLNGDAGNYIFWERTFRERFGQANIDKETTAFLIPESIRYVDRPYMTASLHFVSAIGWLNIVGSGAPTPLHVSPKGVQLRYDDQYNAFHLGFTAIPMGTPTVLNYLNNDGYDGIGIQYARFSGTGTFVVKILAIGE